MRSLLLAVVGFVLISFSLEAQSVGDYQSHQTGNWGSTTTWEQWNGSSWITPVTTVPANIISVVTIQAAHTVTLNVSETVNSGGSVVVNGTLSFSSLLPVKILTVNGSLTNSGTINSTSAKLSFGAGSNYYHNFSDGGTIPSANWNSASTVNIVGYVSLSATAPNGLAQTFGNFTWNSPNQDQAISLGGSPTNIAGNFTVTNTGAGALYYSIGGAGGYTLNVSGNLNVSSVFGFTSGDAAASTLNVTGSTNVSGASGYAALADDQNNTINCTGSFSVTGGATVDLSASTAVANLNLLGDFSQSGSSVITASGGTGNINFNGTSGVQNYTSTTSSVGTVNYNVSSTATLSVAGSNFIGGSGTLSVSGTLQLGSTDSGGAIQTGTSGGNIRLSGTRTFASNSTIVYNGTGAQFIGNAFPSGGVVNLTINNSNNVSLSTNLAIVALTTLNLSSGNIIIGSQTLTINGTVTGSGGIVGGATSNLTIGGTGDFGILTFSGTNQLNNFTINRTSSGLVTLGGNLTIMGTFTHTAGVLAIGNYTFTISGAWGPATPADLLVTGSSTIVVNGSGTVPTDFGFDPGSTALGTFTLNRAGITLPTTSSITITNLNLTSGTFSNGSGITMATGGTITRTGGTTPGAMTSSPTNTTNSYNVIYASGAMTSGPELPSSATALANLSKTGSGTLTLGSAVTVNGTLTLSSGNFSAGTNALTLKGNFVSNAASTLTSSTVTFAGTTTLSGASTPTFGAVTISGALTPSSNFQINGNLVNNGTLNAGSATTTFGGSTAISGSSTSSFNNVTVSGTLTAPSATMSVAGDFVNNGTFTHSNGTVTFVGTTTISGSSTTSLYGVNISGALTAPAGTLNIAGDWATTGTFTHNSGKVVLNGTVAGQSITGTVSVNDVDVSNAVGVNVNGNVNLYGTLTLVASGAFDADGSGSGILTVKSTSVSSGGRIAALPTPANFSGNVTVERFVNSPAGWRYICMPITNGNVGQLQATFPVTGNFSNASPNGVNNVTDATAPSVYYKDMTNGTWASVGSGTATSLTALSNTVGYSAYSYLSNSFTYSTRGSIGKGNIPIPLGTGGDGYNLIANPYPSAIDWDNFTLPGSVGTTLYIRIGNNQYASYVKGAGAGTGTNAPGGPGGWWSGEIATGQSFFVFTSASTSLTLTESVKTSNQYQFLREGAPTNLMRIMLSSGDQTDEAIIWFQSDATDTTDMSYDAPKMRNGDYFSPLFTSSYINLSTYLKSSTTDYAINGIAPTNCPKSVRVKIQDISNADNKLTFTNLNSFNLGYSISLVDNYLNRQVAISEGFEYPFKVTSDPKSFGAGRFEIQFYPASIVRPLVNVSGSLLTSTMNAGDKFQWLLNGAVISGANGAKYVATQSGTYTLQVSNGNCTYQSEDVILVVTGVEGLLSNESIRVYPNPVKNLLTIELLRNFDEIKIYDSIGKQLDSIDPNGANSIQVDFSRYQNGIYLLQGTSSAGGFAVKIVKD